MGYVWTNPPAVPAKKKNGGLSGYYLGDTCVIQPNGARVCTADGPPVITPPPPVITPAAPAPASCPPCPPQAACPTPSPCAPCAVPDPSRGFPTPMPIAPRPRLPIVPVLPPRTVGPVLPSRPISTRLPVAISKGFVNYGNQVAALRARAMLEGLGDTCQVYANGARVCNSAGPAPVPSATQMVCTDEPITGMVPGTLNPNLQVAMTTGPASLVNRFSTAVPAYRTPLPPIRTRRVCRPMPVQTPAPAVPYTTSTLNPVVDNTTLPAAPVPVDDGSGVSLGGFDLSGIPTWAWYVIGAGGVYLLFIRKR